MLNIAKRMQSMSGNHCSHCFVPPSWTRGNAITHYALHTHRSHIRARTHAWTPIINALDNAYLIRATKVLLLSIYRLLYVKFISQVDQTEMKTVIKTDWTHKFDFILGCFWLRLPFNFIDLLWKTVRFRG
jgi:hypothetical protein